MLGTVTGLLLLTIPSMTRSADQFPPGYGPQPRLPAARPANVVNLMDALRRGIGETGAKEKEAKPAGKRAAAAATTPAKKRKKAG